MDFLNGVMAGGMPPLAEAEVKLDLCGQASSVALLRLQDTIEACMKTTTASLFVNFDPAVPGAGDDNLFQPVGNYLRNMKKLGVVKNCYPVVQKEVAGFFVMFRI